MSNKTVYSYRRFSCETIHLKNGKYKGRAWHNGTEIKVEASNLDAVILLLKEQMDLQPRNPAIKSAENRYRQTYYWEHIEDVFDLKCEPDPGWRDD